MQMQCACKIWNNNAFRFALFFPSLKNNCINNIQIKKSFNCYISKEPRKRALLMATWKYIHECDSEDFVVFGTWYLFPLRINVNPSQAEYLRFFVLHRFGITMSIYTYRKTFYRHLFSSFSMSFLFPLSPLLLWFSFFLLISTHEKWMCQIVNTLVFFSNEKGKNTHKKR